MKKVVLAALFAVSSPVFAQGYVGIGFGQSTVDIDSSPAFVSVDDNDTIFGVFIGTEINKNIAIEGGYIDFGSFGANEVDFLTDGSYDYDVVAKHSLEGRAIYAAGIGKMPITNVVDIFAKAGFAFWDVEYSLRGTADVYYATSTTYITTLDLSDSESESGIDPMFGVGINIHASDAFMLRAEFVRFMDVGDENTTGQSDVDVIGLSAAVKF